MKKILVGGYNSGQGNPGAPVFRWEGNGGIQKWQYDRISRADRPALSNPHLFKSARPSRPPASHSLGSARLHPAPLGSTHFRLAPPDRRLVSVRLHSATFGCAPLPRLVHLAPSAPLGPIRSAWPARSPSLAGGTTRDVLFAPPGSGWGSFVPSGLAPISAHSGLRRVQVGSIGPASLPFFGHLRRQLVHLSPPHLPDSSRAARFETTQEGSCKVFHYRGHRSG